VRRNKFKERGRAAPSLAGTRWHALSNAASLDGRVVRPLGGSAAVTAMGGNAVHAAGFAEAVGGRRPAVPGSAARDTSIRSDPAAVVERNGSAVHAVSRTQGLSQTPRDSDCERRSVGSCGLDDSMGWIA